MRFAKRLPQSRSRALVAALLLGPLSAGTALAQFGSIFGGPPPRPPADVPYQTDPRVPSDPRIPDRVFPQYEPPPPPFSRLPPPPGAPPPGGIPSGPPPGGLPLGPPPSAGLPPGPPPSANLPPPPGVQSQPLPPPGAPPQDASLPPQPGPSPLGGLPPGQRQPRGTPQPGGSAPTDEVVVAPPAQKVVNPTAMFSGLDKITGRIISFDVSINETVQFGALRLTPRACYTRPPTETPNTDGFVEVDEITLQGEVKRIFTGWMFASSPGLHGVEHPIYDVWLTDCKKDAPSVAATTPQQSAQGPAPASQPAAAQPAAPAAPTPAPAQPPLRR
jgi:hypothetical protein